MGYGLEGLPLPGKAAQTTKNDPINRGDEGHLELQNAVIRIWLERIDSIKTFDDDLLVLEQDIVDIRQLLGESDKLEVST